MGTRFFVAALLCAVAAPAFGQVGSFHIEGDLAAGGSQDFTIIVLGLNKDDNVLSFATGVGPGADPLTDTTLTMFNEANDQIAFNDDTTTSLYSFLSFDGFGQPGTPIPSPLDQGAYTVTLKSFNTTDAGSWHIDILSDAMNLASLGASTTDVRSFAMDSADYSGVGPVHVTGDFTATGTASFHSSIGPLGGGLTVDGTVSLSYTDLFIDEGFSHLTANGAVILDHSTMTGNVPTVFTLANGKTLTAKNSSNVSFDSLAINNGTTYNVNSGSSLNISGSLDIGNNNTTGTLNVDGTDSTVSAGSFSAWGDNGGTANVQFTNGAAATLAGVTLGGGSIGNNHGIWTIESSATATSSGNIAIGTNDSGGATLTVTGAGSKLTQTGATGITIGGNGSQPVAVNVAFNGQIDTGTGASKITSVGTLNVTKSAIFNANGNVTVNGGTINLATGGVFNANRDVTVDGGTIIKDAASTFALASSRTLTAQNGATITLTGGFTTGGGPLLAPTRVEVKSGSTFSTAGNLLVGRATPGTVTYSSLLVDGTDSSLTTAGGQTFIGTNGGVGVVTVSGGATANFGPSLSMAFSPVDDSDGELDVNPGGHVIVGTINMSAAGHAGNDAVINVVGDGTADSATIDETGLTVGSNGAGGSATITLTNFGAEITGSGDTTINATGFINNISGRFRVRDVTVDGGKFHSSGDVSFRNLTAKNNADVNIDDVFLAEDFGPVNVQSGAHFTVGGYANVGASASTSLTVDGTGSSFTADSMHLALSGATDVTTIRNHASASITNELLIGRGGTSTFTVSNLSTLTMGALAVGEDPAIAPGGGGELDVFSGSTAIQSDGAPLTLGNNTVGQGLLRIAGSTFISGQGAQIIINKTGVVQIQQDIVDDGVNDPHFVGGVFNAQANIFLVGGTIQTLDAASSFSQGVNTSLFASNNAVVSIAGNYVVPPGASVHVDSGSQFAVNGTLSISPTSAVNLTFGTISFGTTTLKEFGRITATGGTISGSMTNNEYVAASTLTSLQNTDADLSGVTLTNTGTIYGNGNVLVSTLNDTAGTLETLSGERLRFGGGFLINKGTINNFNGEVRGTFISNTGMIAGRGQFIAEQQWQNPGVMAFSGGFSDVVGDVLNFPQGKIVTTGGAVTTFYDDVVNNGGEIRTSAGSQSIFLGEVSGTGTFTGTGTVRFEGDLRPGNSPAVVDFVGDVSFGNGASLNIELAGTNLGQFDRLDIGGSVDLDGSLVVTELGNFQVAPNTQFLIMNIDGSRIGTFNGLSEGAPVGTFNGQTLFVTYAAGNGNDVALFTVPEPASAALLVLAAAFCRRRRRVR